MEDLNLLELATALLASWGLGDYSAPLAQGLALLAVVAVAFLADLICRRVVLKAVAKMVAHTKAKWDDVVFDQKVMSRLSHLVAPVVIYLFVPVAFGHSGSWAANLVQRLCFVLVVLAFLRFVHAFLNAFFSLYSDKENYRNRPMKSLLQILLVSIWFVGGIVILSVLIGKDPVSLLAGLGAAATVLMLVFKDTIVGFVSGIQLSANDMLKVGDWIRMPKYDADGVVIEVALTTVKVRNWDNTVTTIPPYALVSDSFQNWNAMRESGGRRIKRAVYIDMQSVAFCTPEMMERFRKIDLLRGYLEKTERECADYNAAHGVAGDDGINGRRQTNLGVFRAYLEAYLRSLSLTNPRLHCMVRHQQPTDKGIPVELYFFSKVKDWIPYEKFQSDVFDHVLAVVPEFGLRVFQSPSGEDVQQLAGRRGALPES